MPKWPNRQSAKTVISTNLVALATESKVFTQGGVRRSMKQLSGVNFLLLSSAGAIHFGELRMFARLYPLWRILIRGPREIVKLLLN